MARSRRSLRGIVRTARPTDLPAVRRLLRRCKLPVGGVNADDVVLLVIARRNEIYGCGAIELLDERRALLRSVAIQPELRGLGLGRMMVDRLLSEARFGAVTDLYLLTTTAKEYFEQFGFEPVARSRTPSPRGHSA